MKTCTKCGQNIPDNAKFCSFCGEVAQEVKTQAESTAQDSTSYYQAPAQGRENEQKALDGLSNRLKWERTAWKITGIVYLVFAIVFLLISFVGTLAGGFLVADNASYSYEYYDGEYYYDDGYGYYSDNVDGEDFVGAIGLVYGVAYGIGGLVGFLPVAIVNLVMASKVGKYREKLYTDCTDGYNHATSVGSIVLGAIFNEIALVFIIINFVLTKNKKAEFDSIKANQSAYNNAQY
ncbi:MAG: zinc ribbon domain-containing protein [Ruminococcus sp.]|nr:zinc ribbon domain-containing protein [Ruminococcus sp.]